MNRKAFNRRIYFTAAIIILISVFFLIKLIDLHFSDKIIIESDKTIEGRRGSIKDRNGNMLAMTIDSWSIYANPEEIQNSSTTAIRLAPVLGASANFIKERLDRKRRFVWLKRKADKQLMEAVSKMKLAGIYSRKEYRRVYPHNNLASNIIGFVGIDNLGLEGIEYQYNSLLNYWYEASALRSSDKPSSGKNIILTIDRYVQKRAEDEIAAAVKDAGAKQGIVIMLDVKSGRILALAKTPNYNANRYYASPEFNLRNFSIIDSYEPGSTMKVFSMAAAYEHKPELFQKSYICNGSIQLGDVVINCERSHGHVKMKDIISQSCNVGVIETMKSVPKEFLHTYLRNFGFGVKTDSGLPGETDGVLRPVNRWSGVSKYSIAIGYEISLTSLQLAAAYAAIANGGIYNTPQIIERIEEADGTLVSDFTPKSKGQICSDKTAALLLNLMRGTITEGTGRRAELEYYHVAGKTGTSRKYSQNEGLYTNSPVASFVGLVPAEAPEICMLVIIDAPASGQGGGGIAAPVFARIARNTLPYLEVKSERIKAQHPLTSKTSVPDFDGKTMPNFTRKSLAVSLNMLSDMKQKTDLTYEIQGSGHVYKQSPEPGQSVPYGSKIVLYLR